MIQVCPSSAGWATPLLMFGHLGLERGLVEESQGVFHTGLYDVLDIKCFGQGDLLIAFWSLFRVRV